MHKAFNYATWTNGGVKLHKYVYIYIYIYIYIYTHTHTQTHTSKGEQTLGDG